MAAALHRRDVLKLGAFALATATVPARAAAPAASTRLLLRYRTNAESLARLIPPGLAPGADPLVDVEIEWFEPQKADILAPKPYGIALFSVAVEHEGTPGRLLVAAYASNDRARLVGREAEGMPVKDALVEVASGEQIAAKITRRGETLFALESGFIVDEPAEAPETPPYLAPVFTLDPDWRGDVVRPGAALWKIEASTAERTLEASQPKAELLYASPGDPLVELPIEETVGCWALMGEPSPAPAPEKIADLDSKAFNAWAPLRFDRPVDRERFWTPAGWREQTTAFRFTDAEIERYHSRKEIRFEPLEIVEIDAMISREAHEALVPPICRTAGRPMIKMLGLRVGGGDLSPVPYSEAWLFAFTITANRMAWYAVSHIVGEGGDLTFGRDVFGYPSKSGAPDIVVTPVDFSMSVKRMGREVAFADGPFHGFSTGTSLAQLPMVSLRARAGGKGAELVYQMWTFQGRRNRVDPAAFQMAFAADPAPGLEQRPDPWYELGSTQPAMLSVMENAVMQRTPGEVVAELPQFEEFYRERCDGVLPWEARPAKLAQPTMLARPAGASS
ncbi:MAG: acetoacetate decarboxylase family protein [Acidobacteria bacterium]|nr:acetoacetate decarboxylase family protein [Acidobacteriota bacterium]